MSDQMSPEENMKEMRRRFQAANDAAATHSQTRRDANDVKAEEKKQRGSGSEAEAGDTAGMDENDSSGG